MNLKRKRKRRKQTPTWVYLTAASMVGAGIVVGVIALLLAMDSKSQVTSLEIDSFDVIVASENIAQPADNRDADPDASRIKRGHQLTLKHCTTCHLEPSPADLPHDRWPFAIQWMAHYLGHDTFTGYNRTLVVTRSMPSEQVVTEAQLQDMEYYFVNSSQSEISPDRVFRNPLLPSPHFKGITFPGAAPLNTASAVTIDERRQRIYVASSFSHELLELSLGGGLIDRHPTNKTQAGGITPTPTGYAAALAGDMYGQEKRGSILVAEQKGQDSFYHYRYPLKEFFRLVHCHVADLNGDRIDDYLASGSGVTGEGAFAAILSRLDDPSGLSKPTYERIDLLPDRGSVSSQTQDIDGDGDLDILVLTTGGRQELWLFRNDGDELFVRRRLWQNRPSYGSTAMLLADLDGNGTNEIVVVTGNNWAIANPPARPYHGVYVFRDAGDLDYQQVFFHPLPGAAACTIDDLNNDGTLDIAAISSLPDWRIPKPTSVLLLMNRGDFEFDAGTLAGTAGTQWASIDSGDVDQDGDKDLLLGAMTLVPNLPKTSLDRHAAAIRKQPSVMFFENTLAKP